MDLENILDKLIDFASVYGIKVVFIRSPVLNE